VKTVVSPKIEAITALADKKLLVRFVGGQRKLYDCAPLIDREPFSALDNESFFRRAKVDVGGYGISWSDDVDLSESELWLNGKAVDWPESG
jgi:hypothetical protein